MVVRGLAVVGKAKFINGFVTPVLMDSRRRTDDADHAVLALCGPTFGLPRPGFPNLTSFDEPNHLPRRPRSRSYRGAAGRHQERRRQGQD